MLLFACVDLLPLRTVHELRVVKAPVDVDAEKKRDARPPKPPADPKPWINAPYKAISLQLKRLRPIVRLAKKKRLLASQRRSLFSKLSSLKGVGLTSRDVFLSLPDFRKKVLRVEKSLLKKRILVRDKFNRNVEAKRLRDMYWKDKKAFWDRILAGAGANASGSVPCPIPNDDLAKFFRGEAEGLASTDVKLDLPSFVEEFTDTQPRPCSPEEDAGKPIDLEEFSKALRRGRNNSAPGWDGFSYALVKRIPSIWPWFVAVFERCRSLRTIPADWKAGHVKLLYKKGDLRIVIVLSASNRSYTAFFDARLQLPTAPA